MVQSKPELILIRGVAGTGKSTYAKETYPNHYHLSTDDYFTKEGVYNFNKSQLRIAHKWCLDETKRLLELGINCVVTNTFVLYRSIYDYLNICVDCDIKVIRLSPTLYMSIHDVPGQTIEKSICEMEDVPNEVIVKVNENEFLKPKRYSLIATDYSGKLTSEELKNWYTVTEQRCYIKKHMRLPSAAPTNALELKALNTVLIAYINAYMPPLRYEWCNMNISRDTTSLDPLTVNYLDINEKDSGSSVINLCPDQWFNPRVTGSLGSYNMEHIPEPIVNHKVLIEVISKSLRIFPREFVLCGGVDGKSPLGNDEYEEILMGMYNEVESNIMLLRKSYVTHFIRRYHNNMSIRDRNTLANLMRCSDGITVWGGYTVLDISRI